jgi:hypothetical protein
VLVGCDDGLSKNNVCLFATKNTDGVKFDPKVSGGGRMRRWLVKKSPEKLPAKLAERCHHPPSGRTDTKKIPERKPKIVTIRKQSDRYKKTYREVSMPNGSHGGTKSPTFSDLASFAGFVPPPPPPKKKK